MLISIDDAKQDTATRNKKKRSVAQARSNRGASRHRALNLERARLNSTS
jgi:hypothetical protein